jgi:hypothetical protein
MSWPLFIHLVIRRFPTDEMVLSNTASLHLGGTVLIETHSSPYMSRSQQRF